MNAYQRPSSNSGAWIIGLAILLAAGGLVGYFAYTRAQDAKAATEQAQRAAEDQARYRLEEQDAVRKYGVEVLQFKHGIESVNQLESAAAKREGRAPRLVDWEAEYREIDAKAKRNVGHGPQPVQLFPPTTRP